MTAKIWTKPGAYYSPIPSEQDAARAAEVDPKQIRNLPGINLRPKEMCDLWHKIAPSTEAMPFADEPGETAFRYYYGNNMHAWGDAAIYFGMLAHFRPNRIVEIGSGFSLALALDARDILGLDTTFTFIEPDTKRLDVLLRDADRRSCQILQQQVQDVPVATFADLEPNDILFIDSSHVAKTGSDVLFEIFEILPVLKPGVIVQIHDCFWPFEYPDRWTVADNRAWNELYFVRAFLMYNRAFNIIFFNHYMHIHHRPQVDLYPHSPFSKRAGGGLWLQRAERPAGARGMSSGGKLTLRAAPRRG